MGLAFLVSVARWAHSPARLAEGLLALAGAVLGRDLTRGPRTLESLGLAQLARASLAARLKGA